MQAHARPQPSTVAVPFRARGQAVYVEPQYRHQRQTYWLGVDGYLMPIAKNQPPPDLRHVNQTQR